ncbi:MAG: hypothetical protein CMP51_04480 [Flavobacteriales bacterium]|nr:hypothetical protein [Flavobacteriales bacterium]|tara:strand:- start:1014 stop:1466 length:453 start_codon:yes stop_codon:yes gene_type:complete
MISKEKLREVIDVKLLGSQVYVVDIKVSNRNDVTVSIDKKGGVSLQECASMSKYIETFFDRDEEDYKLTVCSPGIDSPFHVAKQYINSVGKQIKVLTNEGHEYYGKLDHYGDEIIINGYKNKVNKLNENPSRIFIALDDVKECKRVIKFK